VHVAGAVRRPGLYRIPPDTRVAAAIERAGGPIRRADLAGVNLAAPLQDGQQIVVPLAGGVASGPGGAAGGALATPKPSLGAATVEQLDELDGIGPTLAERIVEYRQSHGGFGSIEQLGEVDGIGEKRLESLREALQP
jgi:competence protein ComEA